MPDITPRWVARIGIIAAAICCLYLVLGVGTPALSDDDQDAQAVSDDAQLATEESLFEEIPVIFTASKRAEPINKAPSVAYVITADEIERSAARSLADILKRVPGMRISIRESSLLGSRGFTSDQNDKFVFLIDNVPITNIMQDGTYNLLDMPDLSMVERIEVIKGPGSTLWGSDATFGIVHIITKTGEDIGGLQTSLDSATGDHHTFANVLYGNTLDNGDYMFSLTYAESKGDTWDSDPGNNAYFWGQLNDEDVLNPWVGDSNEDGGMVGDDAVRMLDISPSIELYGKVRIGDTTFKSRLSYMSEAYLWNTVYGEKYTDAIMKHFYGEVEHISTFSEDRTLTTRLNVHTMQYERGVPRGYDDPEATTNTETMAETGLSLESIYSARIADQHSLIAGLKIVTTRIGPSTSQNVYMGDGTAVPVEDPNDYPYGEGYYVTVDPATDNVYGLYLEDSYDATDRFTVVGGASYEYNDLREVGGKIMPRIALIYDVGAGLTAKYAYNTGFQRPPAQKRFSRLYGSVTESEEVTEHDVQLMYRRNGTSATVTGFQYEINHYFTWFDDRVYDDNGDYVSGLCGHTNRGNAEGTGVELDVHHRISDAWTVYTNALYAYTSINDASIVGEPRYVFNIGVDWSYADDLTVNLNVNGWRKMYHGDVEGEGQWWNGAGEEIVDLSVVADNLGDRPLTLTVYVQNLLDNKVHVGMTGWPGYTYLPGTSVGAKVAYKF